MSLLLLPYSSIDKSNVCLPVQTILSECIFSIVVEHLSTTLRLCLNPCDWLHFSSSVASGATFGFSFCYRQVVRY